MTYALQNACLNGCGYVTFPVFAYVCTLWRNKLLYCTSEPSLIKIQDCHIKATNMILLYSVRIIVIGVMCVPLALPALLLKVDDVGGPIAIMFTNIVIPAALGGYFLCGGPYEIVTGKIINRIQ